MGTYIERDDGVEAALGQADIKINLAGDSELLSGIDAGHLSVAVVLLSS